MVVDINDFNGRISAINKNYPIFLSEAKIIEAQMLRLKNFRAQARMERIFFKKEFLFLKSFLQLAFFKISEKTFIKRQNFHKILATTGKIRRFSKALFQAL